MRQGAEEPLPPGGSCLLGSINLSEFVVHPFTDQAYFAFNTFSKTVKISVKALNEVLHEGLPLHPLQEQKDSVNNWRQIGLGLFGWHDTLIKMGIKYGDHISLYMADLIGREMINSAVETSALLTKEYGCYPKYNQKAIMESEFFQMNISNKVKSLVEQYGLANSQLLTIPPTGSTATMLGVSTAIEPIYNISYNRRTQSLDGKDIIYKVYTPIVKQYMDAKHLTDESKLPDFINTAMTLNYKERIIMQANWQKHIDASISSTVNVPNDFTVDDTKDLYITAWKSGCKGVTLFRDGCARTGILTNNSNNVKQDKEKETKKKIPNSEDSTDSINTIKQFQDFPRGYVEDVPTDLIYHKYKLQTGCGKLYLFVGVDENEGKIYDVFTNTNGAGGCVVNTQAVSRLLSAGMRGGVDIQYLIEQLNKAGVCPSFSYHKGKGEKLSKGKSCASAIGNVLQDVLDKFKKEKIEEEKEENIKMNVIKDTDLKQQNETETDIMFPTKVNKKNNDMICPECGNKLQSTGGCKVCKYCGWSKCD